MSSLLRPHAVLFGGAAALLAGCASTPAAAPAERGARLVSTNAPVTCAEWVSRAQASPELDVDRVPSPVRYDPAPVPKRMPPGVAGPDGRAEVSIKVMVDTLGRADMKTFKVVRSTHPSLSSSVRTAVAKWKFEPAVVHGCKVPRVFNWSASAGGTRRSTPSGTPAGTRQAGGKRG
jgi:hypothetical protein